MQRPRKIAEHRVRALIAKLERAVDAFGCVLNRLATIFDVFTKPVERLACPECQTKSDRCDKPHHVFFLCIDFFRTYQPLTVPRAGGSTTSLRFAGTNQGCRHWSN